MCIARCYIGIIIRSRGGGGDLDAIISRLKVALTDVGAEIPKKTGTNTSYALEMINILHPHEEIDGTRYGFYSVQIPDEEKDMLNTKVTPLAPFPNSLTITRSAVQRCIGSKAKSVNLLVIPGFVQVIDNNAFVDLTNLNKVYILTYNGRGHFIIDMMNAMNYAMYHDGDYSKILAVYQDVSPYIDLREIRSQAFYNLVSLEEFNMISNAVNSDSILPDGENDLKIAKDAFDTDNDAYIKNSDFTILYTGDDISEVEKYKNSLTEVYFNSDNTMIKGVSFDPLDLF